MDTAYRTTCNDNEITLRPVGDLWASVIWDEKMKRWAGQDDRGYKDSPFLIHATLDEAKASVKAWARQKLGFSSEIAWSKIEIPSN